MTIARHKEPLVILKEMRSLLGDEARWTRGTLARSAKQRPVAVFSHRAAAWCLTGAALRCCSEDNDDFDKSSLNAVLYELWQAGSLSTDIAQFNDNPATHHADVLALIDRALARMEGGIDP